MNRARQSLKPASSPDFTPPSPALLALQSLQVEDLIHVREKTAGQVESQAAGKPYCWLCRDGPDGAADKLSTLARGLLARGTSVLLTGGSRRMQRDLADSISRDLAESRSCLSIRCGAALSPADLLPLLEVGLERKNQASPTLYKSNQARPTLYKSLISDTSLEAQEAMFWKDPFFLMCVSPLCTSGQSTFKLPLCKTLDSNRQ